MQATIRLDGGQGRDRGVIVVREAPVVSGPLFFTLQRFPDGKYLSADSLWFLSLGLICIQTLFEEQLVPAEDLFGPAY